MTNSELNSFTKFLKVYTIMCQAHRHHFPHWVTLMPVNTLENFSRLIMAGPYYMKLFLTDMDAIDDMDLNIPEFECDIEFIAQCNPTARDLSRDIM